MASAKSDIAIAAAEITHANKTENADATDDVKFDATPESTDFSKPAIIGRMEASVLGVAQACSNLKECTDKLLADLPQSTQLIRAMHAANADNPCFGLAAFAQQLARLHPKSDRLDSLLAAVDDLNKVWKATPALSKCTPYQLDKIQSATNKVLSARYQYIY